MFEATSPSLRCCTQNMWFQFTQSNEVMRGHRAKLAHVLPPCISYESKAVLWAFPRHFRLASAGEFDRSSRDVSVVPIADHSAYQHGRYTLNYRPYQGR